MQETFHENIQDKNSKKSNIYNVFTYSFSKNTHHFFK